MVKPPIKPILGYLLYKYLGIKTKRYSQYWKNYCEYMQYKLIMSKP